VSGQLLTADQLGLDLAAADPGPLREIDDGYISDLAEALERGRGTPRWRRAWRPGRAGATRPAR